jgi:hypothetical protein
MGDDDATSSTSRGWGDVLLLPPCFDNKAILCQLCGLSSHDKSPFPDALHADRYGGRHPWKRYVRMKALMDHKEPAERTCLICFSAFAIGPLALQHGTIKKYTLHIRGHPEDNAPFLKMVKKLVQKIIADPRGYIVVLANLNPGTMHIVDEELKQGRRVIVRFTFVTLLAYTDLYVDKPEYANIFGELDSAAEVSKSLGPMVGYWARGDFNSTLDGHFLVEDYEDASVVHTKRFEDSSTVLGKGQSETKFAALVDMRKGHQTSTRSKLKKLSPQRNARSGC